VSAPLKTNMTVIGAGAVHLWVRSSTPNVDLQATISEARPDGNETFVQNGRVRADERKLATTQNNMLDQRSTLLEPVLSVRASDVQPMPKGRFVEVVIPLYHEGHVYRAGSRIRVTTAAPNRTQPIWSFSQSDRAGLHREGLGRVLEDDAVEPDPAGGSERERADRAATVPEPAQRAVPALRGALESD
jgi:uncharacterized protein